MINLLLLAAGLYKTLSFHSLEVLAIVNDKHSDDRAASNIWVEVRDNKVKLFATTSDWQRFESNQIRFVPQPCSARYNCSCILTLLDTVRVLRWIRPLLKH